MKLTQCANYQGNEICSLYNYPCDKVKTCYQKRFKKAKTEMKKRGENDNQ